MYLVDPCEVKDTILLSIVKISLLTGRNSLIGCKDELRWGKSQITDVAVPLDSIAVDFDVFKVFKVDETGLWSDRFVGVNLIGAELKAVLNVLILGLNMEQTARVVGARAEAQKLEVLVVDELVLCELRTVKE